MSNTHLVAAGVWAAVMLWPCSALGQGLSVTAFEVTVLDRDGTGVPGARIEVDGGCLPPDAPTNRDGQATVTCPKAGSYSIRAIWNNVVKVLQKDLGLGERKLIYVPFSEVMQSIQPPKKARRRNG